MPPPAQLGGMGERWKLPLWGLGRSPRNFAVDLNILLMKECNYVIKVLYFNGLTEMF